MALKNITTIRTHTDFHEYVDFTQNKLPLDVSAWQFKIKVLDAEGTEHLSVASVQDLTLTNRVWFNSLQATLADLPDSGLTWYLLALDPDGFISLVNSGEVKTEGGALWD